MLLAHSSWPLEQHIDVKTSCNDSAECLSPRHSDLIPVGWGQCIQRLHSQGGLQVGNLDLLLPEYTIPVLCLQRIVHDWGWIGLEATQWNKLGPQILSAVAPIFESRCDMYNSSMFQAMISRHLMGLWVYDQMRAPLNFAISYVYILNVCCLFSVPFRWSTRILGPVTSHLATGSKWILGQGNSSRKPVGQERYVSRNQAEQLRKSSVKMKACPRCSELWAIAKNALGPGFPPAFPGLLAARIGFGLLAHAWCPRWRQYCHAAASLGNVTGRLSTARVTVGSRHVLAIKHKASRSYPGSSMICTLGCDLILNFWLDPFLAYYWAQRYP